MLASKVVALEHTLREGDGSMDARPASRSLPQQGTARPPLPRVRGTARVDQFILFGDVDNLLAARAGGGQAGWAAGVALLHRHQRQPGRLHQKA